MTGLIEQQIQAPQPLNAAHQTMDFDSGNAELDKWLRKRALKNEASGASRTYVVTVASEVIAYYCLANGSVVNTTAPGKVRRNMPFPDSRHGNRAIGGGQTQARARNRVCSDAGCGTAYSPGF